MDPTLRMILGVLMRWVHISSVVILIGSAYYALRTTRTLAPQFRSTVYTGIAGILVSGLYNFLMKTSYPPHYHMWFGIKALFALHVIAALFLVSGRTGDQSKSLRSLVGSAMLVVAISAYLRWISLL